MTFDDDSIPTFVAPDPGNQAYIHARSNVLLLPWSIVERDGRRYAELFIANASENLKNPHYAGGYEEGLSTLIDRQDLRVLDTENGRYLSLPASVYAAQIEPHIYFTGPSPVVLDEGTFSEAAKAASSRLHTAPAEDRFAELTSQGAADLIALRIKRDLFAIPNADWKHSIATDKDTVRLVGKAAQQHYSEHLSGFLTRFYPASQFGRFTIRPEGDNLLLTLTRKAHNQLKDDISAEQQRAAEKGTLR